ncbi:MAG: pyridoxal phosphate-dependent aminotransferase [Candidatus Heimdallarchaeota archaeon]|nr:MAG: pyridoxal phosphate-dependent aminotransferase [Candidatus Heimdallarchaeota archaeon]
MTIEKKNLNPKRTASRLSQIRPSGLRKLFDLEHKLSKSSSHKILSFGLGNLNIPTMPEIISQLKIALDDPVSHRYSPNAGLLELREALVARYKTEYHLDYTTDQIVITSGCLEALIDAFIALIDPGDEVLIQDPTFGYYASQISLAGGKVRPVPLNDKFELEADLVNEAITSKTKALVLNFPCNPTGSVMSREEIRAVVETAADKGIIIISDEAYEAITFNGHKHTCAAEIDYDNVIIISSFSKTYCMTGFRVGYVLAPPELLSPISLVHQYNTACANSPAQIAAKIALHSPSSIREVMMKKLIERRAETIKAFTSVEGIKLNYNPLGAFYIYPDIGGLGMNGTEFSEFLLENCQIVVVPGTEFGTTTPNHVRISYGFLNQKDIREAGTRIHSCFSKTH